MVRAGLSSNRPPQLAITGLVAVLLLCWMLLMPQGSHPDEASHLVRSAALVRAASEQDGVYLLPDRFVVAEPACYAFDPRQPASCAAVPEPVGVAVPTITRADSYPPAAHLVFGLAAQLPGLAPVWWARLVAVLASAALLGAALTTARRHRPATAAALLLGLTPMAWSIMAAVNPSAFATAGAAALWIGVLRFADGDDRAGWLLTAGWIALVLPRRDGLVWACLIVALVALVSEGDLLTWARRLQRVQVALIAGSALGMVLWALVAGDRTTRALALAPLVFVAAELARRWWYERDHDDLERRGAVAGAAVVGVVGWLLLLAARPGGWNTDLAVDVVAQTDENLVEAVGVLGWLDTSVPWFVVFGWIFLVGLLAAGAVAAGTWRPAAGLVALTVVTSWTFELFQGNESGTYWQGRYSLPLLVGLPLLLVRRTGDDAGDRRVAATAAWGALLFVDVAAWAAARRFGVGTGGTHLPWRWDTPVQPVPPVVLLAVLAACTVLVARWATDGHRHGDPDDDR